METQPVYREENTQKRQLKPSSKGYVHWHILNRFKAQIEELMQKIDESNPEQNLVDGLQPIHSEMGSYISHLACVIGSENEQVG